MNGKWIEVFKTGKHTAGDGTTRIFTKADLDRICSLYNPSVHEAPFVVGHPQHNQPAFGWVEQIRRNGNILEVKARQVPDEFSRAVKNGLFKKRSISLYPDGSLRHVGFLGARPPAVKGLSNIEFNDGEMLVTFEFRQGSKSINTTKEVKMAGNDKYKTEIDKAEYHADKPSDKPSDKKEDEILTAIKTIKENTAALQELKKSVETLKTENERINAEMEKLSAQTQELFALRQAENFCESLISAGKITPAMKEKTVEILKAAEVKNFAEAQDLKEILLNLPVQVDFGEFAVNGHSGAAYENSRFQGLNLDKTRAKLYALARQYQEEDKTLTFAKAVDKARADGNN